MTWIKTGIKAIKKGFDLNEQIDPTKSEEEIEEAKKLFYKCIEQGPEEAWPYIKLADLLTDKEEKIKVYKQSLLIEETDFVKARLYELLY
jgi:hypothetical protein